MSANPAEIAYEVLARAAEMSPMPFCDDDEAVAMALVVQAAAELVESEREFSLECMKPDDDIERKSTMCDRISRAEEALIESLKPVKKLAGDEGDI